MRARARNAQAATSRRLALHPPGRRGLAEPSFAGPSYAGQVTATATTFSSLDPRTGEVVGTYPVHDAAAVEAAVARAAGAARWWADLGFDGRSRRLRAWKKALVRGLDRLAELDLRRDRQAGRRRPARVGAGRRPPRLGRAGTPEGARPARVRTGILMANQAATLEYPPLGVIGVIGPWNYPVFTPMGSIAYALAAGNAVVFKPSELTPGVGVAGPTRSPRRARGGRCCRS